jgi:acetyl esterase/lipase
MTIRILEFLDALLLSWCEPFFFYFWSKIMPISLKRKINRIGWKLFCKVHTILLGKSTGVHPTTSVEYHALTTAMWFAQYFVITPRRIRFSLGEQHTISARGMPQKDQVEIINVDMRMTNASVGSSSDPSSQFISENEIPESQQDHCHVRGMYIHCGANCKNVNTEQQHRKIIFWIYGGAYLGGDVLSNASVGNEFGQDCQVDVFIPEFRLAPESTIDDVLWDVCLAYLWVLRRAQYDGSNVCVLGLSSGGALALRLLQLIAERHQYQPPEDLTPSFLAPIVDKMAPKCAPKCAVFLGPYIDYTMPKKGSFLHYSKHDLVVTEAVQDYCLPYLNDFIPRLGDDLNGSNSIRGGGGESKNTNQPHNSTGRKIYSPVHRSFRGVSPTSLCFVVSEHEVTFDMTIEAANKAREEGCDVTVGVWKYMCHVWPCLQSMIPEGKIAMDFTKRYINLHMTK